MSKKEPEEAAEAEAPTKPKYFKEQFDDEDVRLVFRKHPIVMRKGLLLASAGLLAGPLYTLILTYAHKNDPPSISFFFISLLTSFILALILIFPWWVRWYFSVYIMTDRRFIQQTRSLLQVNVVDIGLDQIQMINYQILGLEETVLRFTSHSQSNLADFHSAMYQQIQLVVRNQQALRLTMPFEFQRGQQNAS